MAAIAVWVTALIVPGIHLTRGDGQALLAVPEVSAVLGLVNALVRPLLRWLSCGSIVLTLGIFLVVVNSLTLWLAAAITSNLPDVGFYIDGFWPALAGAIIISVVSFALSILLPAGTATADFRS